MMVIFISLLFLVQPIAALHSHCSGCEHYLGHLINVMGGDEQVEFQVNHLVNTTCDELSIPDCELSTYEYWPRLQATLSDSIVLRAMCLAIDAPGNCDEWNMDRVTCVSCQARLGQFGTIVLNTEALDGYIEALKEDFFCQSICDSNDDECLNHCTNYVALFTPSALNDLMSIMTSMANKACNLTFQVC